MSVTAGQIVGSCRILEQIGQGGMGTVYRAYQPALDRVVAVKVLTPLLTSDPTALARFRREAQTVASFRHPHILTVFDFGEQDGLAYLVTEFAAGGTLRERMTRQFSISETTGILRPIGQALDYAHARDVVHRDVKPANVLIHADGTLVLSDFGLAHSLTTAQLQQLTASGLLVGTPAYMAPEQGRSSQVGAPADLYSLGVIAYELLTGTVPFSGETPISTMLAHIQDTLPLARQRNPALPADVEAVLQRALAKRPEDRFATAEHFIHALESADHPALQDATLASTRTASLPPPPSTSTPPSLVRDDSTSRHRRVPLAGLAAVVSALVIVAVLFAARGANLLGPAPEPRPILQANWQVLPGQIPQQFTTLAVDRAGFLFAVADDHRIQKLSPTGQVVAGPWGTAGGPLSLDMPRGVALDTAGGIYVTEAGSVQRIQKLKVREPGWIQTIARVGTTGSATGQFSAPAGIAVAADGSVYVADTGNNRVQKFSPTGQPVSGWGGSTQFAAPLGLTLDAEGNVYVTDTGNDRVQKLSSDGHGLATWGTHGTAAGQFSAPSGVALDPTGNLFVTDTENNRLQKLSPKGEPLAQWGTAGSGPGEFNLPTGVAVDASGNVFVADSGNQRLQELVAPHG